MMRYLKKGEDLFRLKRIIDESYEIDINNGDKLCEAIIKEGSGIGGILRMVIFMF